MAHPPALVVEIALPATGELRPVADVQWMTWDDPTYGVWDDGLVWADGGSVWVDVSDRRRMPAVLRRGRERELDDATTGSTTLVLDNRDRALDPTNAASPYAGLVRPMRRVRMSARTADGAVTPVWAGYVTDWGITDPSPEDSLTTVVCDGVFAPLAAAELAETTPSDAGDLTGTRIGRVLDKPEVAYPQSRNIDVGNSTLGATTYGTGALSYLQAVARSENGTLIEGRDGTVVFRGRHSAAGSAPQVTFGPSDIRYTHMELDKSAQLLRNRVRTSGTSGVEFVAADAESISQFFPRTLDRTGLLLDADAEVEAHGQFLLNRYATDEVRPRAVTVDMAALSVAEQKQVLSLEGGDRVRVRSGAGLDLQCVVEGFEHSKPLIGWTVSLFLAAADTAAVLIWDDPQSLWDGTSRWSY